VRGRRVPPKSPAPGRNVGLWAWGQPSPAPPVSLHLLFRHVVRSARVTVRVIPFRCADPPIPGFAIGRSQPAVRAQQPPRSGLTPAAKDAEGATRHHRPALSLTAPRVGTASSAGLDPAPARCRPRPARTAGPPTPGRNAGTSRCGARCARRCTRTVPSPRRPVRRRRRDHPGMRRVVARTQHDPA